MNVRGWSVRVCGPGMALDYATRHATTPPLRGAGTSGSRHGWPTLPARMPMHGTTVSPAHKRSGEVWRLLISIGHLPTRGNHEAASTIRLGRP